MSHDSPKSPPESGQIIPRDSGLKRATTDDSKPLSEIIARSLIHIQTSKNLSTLHRIGEYELFDPDYRMICTWGEELRLSPQEIMDFLHTEPHNSVKISNGKITEIELDHYFFEVSGIPDIKGLEIENLCLSFFGTNKSFLQRFDLSIFPRLVSLVLFDCGISDLNIEYNPRLKSLHCAVNRIHALDLSKVPNLLSLCCSDNPLHEINLTSVPNLTQLFCRDCSLNALELSSVPNLKQLDCSSNCGERWPTPKEWASRNQLQELNLEFVQKLEVLDCSGNPLGKLDLSPVPKLMELVCEFIGLRELDVSAIENLKALACKRQFEEEPIPRGIHIIQRPDQNFR